MAQGTYSYFTSTSASSQYYLGIENSRIVLVPSSAQISNLQNILELRLEWKYGILPIAGFYVPSGSPSRSDYRRYIKSRTHTADSLVVYTGTSNGTQIQIQGSSIPLYGGGTVNLSTPLTFVMTTPTYTSSVIQTRSLTDTSSTVSTISLPITTGLANWYYGPEATPSTNSSWTWRDKSGNNRAMTISSVTPKDPENYVLFNSVATSDGTRRRGTASTGMSQKSRTFTLFAVVNILGATPLPNRWLSTLCVTDSNEFVGNTDTSGSSVSTDYDANGTFYLAVGTGTNGYEYSLVEQPNFITTGKYVIAVTYNDGQVNFYRGGGTPIGTHTIQKIIGGRFDGSVNLSNIAIGNSNGSLDYPFNGGIGEFVLYNRVLNSTEIQTVTNTLRGRWTGA